MNGRFFQPWRWAAYPLGLYFATRAAYVALAWFGVRYAVRFGRAGVPAHFLADWAPLRLLAHGEIGAYAGFSLAGSVRPDDVLSPPLLPGIAWIAAALGMPVDLTLGLMGNLATAALFVVVFRVFEAIDGQKTARWGLAFLAAFPFAFHLGDGSALAWLALGTALAVLLALRGDIIPAAGATAVSVLAHPAAASAVVALAALRGRSRLPPAVRWAFALSPLLVLAAWGAFAMTQQQAASGGSAWLLRVTTLPPAAWLWALLPAITLVAGGIALLGARRQSRWLALASAATLLVLLGGHGVAAGQTLTACWGAFLPLGALAARAPTLGAAALAITGAHQGLLLYLHVHHVPPP